MRFSEAPAISDLNDTALLPGMTFAIEPGISIPSAGGVGTGDTVAATADGCKVLTAAQYSWRR